MGLVAGFGAFGAHADVVIAAIGLQEALMLAAELVFQVGHSWHQSVGLECLHLAVWPQVRLTERTRTVQTRFMSLGKHAKQHVYKGI